ncbi:MAG: hypothetical protein KC501_10295 [Myxococcales bacterium]|nr:hypothetical protein [Myxococcales bacterium]
MKTSTIVTVAVTGLGLLLVGGRSHAASTSNGDGVQAVAPVRGLAAEAGLPTAWGDFLALVAWNESKGNPQARNDDDSEAKAAAEAYARNRERFAGCGHPESAYTFGSGGWFGMLPANALAQLGDAHRCLPPSSVFEPRVAIAMAVGFARGLMGWSRYQRVPTWLNLRAMWGWPTKGGDHAYLAKAKPKFEQDARDVGLPASWLDGTPPPLSTSASEVLARLRA